MGHRLAALCALGLLAAAPAAQAQGGPVAASPARQPAGDATGTNPVNLRHQIDAAGTFLTRDGRHLQLGAYRHAVPIFGRRVRLGASVPYGSSDVTGTDVRGLGDVGADLEWVPWLGPTGGVLIAVRTTWGTGQQGLGLGTNTVMPFVQWVRRVSPAVFVAPFAGRRTSAGGDEFAFAFNDTSIGVAVVWRPSDRTWLSTTPQLVIDHEAESTFGDVGVEAGYLLTGRLSIYGRPSFGLGPTRSRPYAWGVVAGVRIVS